ncbi:MAG: thioredoxin family protein [Thermodesulfobacteriota bacterium]
MRTIEVFTAGCPLCNDTLKLVKETVKGCGCEVIERRCSGDECCPEAKSYGIKAVPTIVVDGVIVHEGRPTPEWAEKTLRL